LYGIAKDLDRQALLDEAVRNTFRDDLRPSMLKLVVDQPAAWSRFLSQYVVPQVRAEFARLAGGAK
jgi:hypothetical protein